VLFALTIMSNLESGDGSGASAKVDVPDKTFKDDKEAIAFWKALAQNYKESNLRLSQEVEIDRQNTSKVQSELEQLRRTVNMLTHEGDNPSGSRSSELPRLGNMKPESEMLASNSEVKTSFVNLDAIPKLTIFNGKDGSNDYPYDNWRFDIMQLISSGFSSRVIRMAIVRSCRGTPATVLQSLGENFHPEEVLAAFDKRFASVATPESLLSQFYSSTQKDGES
jgi:hypothetical protein